MMLKNHLNPYTVNRMARAFIGRLRVKLGDDTVDHIAKLDLLYHDPRICYSHDYCDANMVMLAAFEDAVGRELNFDSDADLHLWEEAWDLARDLHYGCAVELIVLEVAE